MLCYLVGLLLCVTSSTTVDSFNRDVLERIHWHWEGMPREHLTYDWSFIDAQPLPEMLGMYTFFNDTAKEKREDCPSTQ